MVLLFLYKNGTHPTKHVCAWGVLSVDREGCLGEGTGGWEAEPVVQMLVSAQSCLLSPATGSKASMVGGGESMSSWSRTGISRLRSKG